VPLERGTAYRPFRNFVPQGNEIDIKEEKIIVRAIIIVIIYIQEIFV